MKQITFLLKGSLDNAVPIISIAQALNAGNNEVVFICGSVSEELKNELEDLGIKIRILKINENVTNSFFSVFIKLKYWLAFRRKVKKQLKKEKFDYLYISTGDTAIALRGLFEKKIKYFLHLRELYDQYPMYMHLLKKPAKQAYKVIVPEENRAYLYHVFLKLKDIPIVIPNKTFYHPRTPKMDISFLEEQVQDQIKSKKNIVYQGHLNKERDLTSLIKASVKIEQYNIILMGKDFGMLPVYKNINPNIIHIPFTRPPLHLNITSWANIGIITYDLNSLNTIYCAPNKIWEFTGFNIPILGNRNPGIRNFIEKYNIGSTIDFLQENEVLLGIKQIEKDNSYYSEMCSIVFESFNFESINSLLVN